MFFTGLPNRPSLGCKNGYRRCPRLSRPGALEREREEEQSEKKEAAIRRSREGEQENKKNEVERSTGDERQQPIWRRL